MSWSGVRRVLVVAVVALLLGTAAGVGTASAHSSLARSDPPDGGVVSVGRTELSLWFDEPIDLTTGRFLLRTSDGRPLLVTADPTTASSTFVELRTAPLSRGVLILSWTVSSAVDGHVSSGSMTFGAGVRPAPLASGESGPSALDVVVRWLELAALLVAIGSLVAPALLGRTAPFAPQAPRQAARLGAVAALVCLLASLSNPSGVADGLATDLWAQAWVLRAVALLVSVVALVWLAREGPSLDVGYVAGLALGAAVVADAASGHAAGLPRASAIAIAATSVHVVAAGVWIGTLAVLAACLLPTMRQQPESRRPLLETTWRAFGPVAAVAATLVVASGLYLAGRHVPSLSSLTSGWYGVALVGKTLLLAVALGTAFVTLSVIRPGLVPRALDPGRVPRLMLTELGVLATAVVLAAVMTTVPTARTVSADRVQSGTSTGVTVDGLFITFAAVPAGTGEYRMVVRVNAVTRPQPGPVTGADVLLMGEGAQVPVRLHQVEPGHFEGSTPTPASGDWQAWVSVHRPTVADAVAPVDWRYAPASTPGAGRLEVITTVLATLLGLGALVAAGVLVVRRRPTTSPPFPAPRRVALGGPKDRS